MPSSDRARRAFLHATVSAGGAGALVSIGYPVARFLQPLQPARSAPSAIDVCADAQLAPGQIKLVELASLPVIIVRRHDGTLAAFGASCTHLGCTLGFDADKDELHCACHGAAFDPSTGACRSGPATSPLTRFAVEVRHGRVVVQP